MSIASEISRLSGVREDIFTSITNKGVTVPATATFSSCPALIDSITGGGSGPATSMINPNFTASGFASGYRPFTATQNEVPLYDNYSGSYETTITNDNTMVKIPSIHFTGNLYNYILTHIIELNAIGGHLYLCPDLANPYSNLYYINDFDVNRRYDYVGTNKYSCTFGGSEFLVWYNSLQKQPWIATAYTGDSIYLCIQGIPSIVISQSADYFYNELTGYEKAYPDYPTTTTGYITNEISGIESFTGNTNKVPNIYVSGFKNVVYDNSPEGGASVISPSNINLTSFSSNMLKNNIAAKSNYELNSTAYSYSYGSVNSAYSGFEGV